MTPHIKPVILDAWYTVQPGISLVVSGELDAHRQPPQMWLGFVAGPRDNAFGRPKEFDVKTGFPGESGPTVPIGQLLRRYAYGRLKILAFKVGYRQKRRLRDLVRDA